MKGPAGIQELQAIHVAFGLSRYRLSTGLRLIRHRISSGLRSIPPPCCKDPRSPGYSTGEGCHAQA
eukprot:1980244-Pyramimonas_sp.AAC.1